MRICIAATILRLVIVCALVGATHAFAAEDYRLSADQELFSHFDTVGHAETEVIRYFATKDAASDFAIAITAPFSMFMGGLRALSPGTENTIVEGFDAIESGVKDIVPIRKLGIATGTQCYVAVSHQEKLLDLSAAFVKAVQVDVEGQPAWTWVVPTGGGSRDQEHLYASQINEHYFLLCNDRQTFLKVSNDLRSSSFAVKDGASAIPFQSVQANKFWLIQPRGQSSKTAAFLLYSNIFDKTGYFEARVDPEKGTTAESNQLPSPQRMRYVRMQAGVFQSAISLDSRAPTLDRLYIALGALQCKIAI